MFLDWFSFDGQVWVRINIKMHICTCDAQDSLSVVVQFFHSMLYDLQSTVSFDVIAMSSGIICQVGMRLKLQSNLQSQRELTSKSSASRGLLGAAWGFFDMSWGCECFYKAPNRGSLHLGW